MKSACCWTLQAHKTVQKAVEWYLMSCLLLFSRANFPKGEVSRAILATYQICTINYSQTRVYIVGHLHPWITAHFSPCQANDTASTVG